MMKVIMPVTVSVPPLLYRATRGRAEIVAEGGTVGEIFAFVEGEHAGFLDGLTTRGELLPWMSVFVNGSDIRPARGLDTPVGDGDEVAILPAITGGR